MVPFSCCLLCFQSCRAFPFYHFIQRITNSPTPCSTGLLKAISHILSPFSRYKPDWIQTSYLDNGKNFFFCTTSFFFMQTTLPSSKHTFDHLPDEIKSGLFSKHSINFLLTSLSCMPLLWPWYCGTVWPLLSLLSKALHLWDIYKLFGLAFSTNWCHLCSNTVQDCPLTWCFPRVPVVSMFSFLQLSLPSF